MRSSNSTSKASSTDKVEGTALILALERTKKTYMEESSKSKSTLVIWQRKIVVNELGRPQCKFLAIQLYTLVGIVRGEFARALNMFMLEKGYS